MSYVSTLPPLLYAPCVKRLWPNCSIFFNINQLSKATDLSAGSTRLPHPLYSACCHLRRNCDAACHLLITRLQVYSRLRPGLERAPLCLYAQERRLRMAESSACYPLTGKDPERRFDLRSSCRRSGPLCLKPARYRSMKDPFRAVVQRTQDHTLWPGLDNHPRGS